MNITDTFIDGLITKFQTIPFQVTEKAKECLLDYLGVVIGGIRFLKEVQ